jgi:hypothetical protein
VVEKEENESGSSTCVSHNVANINFVSVVIHSDFHDGNVIVTDMDIEEGELLDVVSYEDRDPDEHEYERHEGYSTHYFRDSILTLVPNEYIADVLLAQATGSDAEVLEVSRHLDERARNSPWAQEESLRKSLRRVCLIISDNPVKTSYRGLSSRKYQDSTVSKAITVCAEFGLTDLFPGLSSAFKDGLSADALECIRNLKHTMDLSLPEERTRLETM